MNNIKLQLIKKIAHSKLVNFIWEATGTLSVSVWYFSKMVIVISNYPKLAFYEPMVTTQIINKSYVSICLLSMTYICVTVKGCIVMKLILPLGKIVVVILFLTSSFSYGVQVHISSSNESIFWTTYSTISSHGKKIIDQCTSYGC